MGRLIRVDQELVRRGLAKSRTHAQELIAARKVTLENQVVDKPARQMDKAQALCLTADAGENWVSRGAYKLLGALDALGNEGPEIVDQICLDAGASTGGFTDVLLRKGARQVYCVDVGYGQLDWSIRNNNRVTTIERTNIRHLDPELLNPKADLVVADLSFISLTLVMGALLNAAKAEANFLLMVKPQFEVGKTDLGRGGVVTDTALHEQSVRKVCDQAIALGLTVRAVVPSPLPGPAGNVEYFVYLQRPAGNVALTGSALDNACAQAVISGPATRRTERKDLLSEP